MPFTLTEELERLRARKAELEAIPPADRTPADVAELAEVNTRLARLLPPDPAAPCATSP